VSKPAKPRRFLMAAGLIVALWSAGAAVTNQSASAGGDVTCVDLSNVRVTLGTFKWDPNLVETCRATPLAELIEDVLDLILRGYSPSL
jgi:hypothetical protein